MGHRHLPQTLDQERKAEAHLLETERPAAADENVFDTLLTLKSFNDKRDQKAEAAHIYGMYDEEVYYLDRAVQILMTEPIGSNTPLEAKSKEEAETALLFQRKYGRNLAGAKLLAKKLKEKADAMNEELYYRGYVSAIVEEDRARAGQTDTAALAVTGMIRHDRNGNTRIGNPDRHLFRPHGP